jgi:gamma-glutamyltranspeptidase/glutathione hydrolase
MTLTPAGHALFQAEGRYLREGHRYKNLELAAFLETLLDTGEREFYQGEIACRIAQDMKAGQGLVTQADLAAYRVIEREPLVTRYRGFSLYTNPPPSLGGALLALALRLLENCPVNAFDWGSSAHTLSLVAVMAEVDRCRAEGFTNLEELSDRRLVESLGRVRTASGGTTHISVCDVEGNSASMTTSNGEGSGYMVPGTGIMLNNMLGEDDLHPDGFHSAPPGQRVVSMMSPSVLTDGQAKLVLGSGGSKRIRTAMLQVISNMVDFGMAVREAVEAPRLHWDGHCVQAEPGFSQAVLAALGKRWKINPWSVRDLYFGGVHAVSSSGLGAGDPRRGGHAVVVE